MSKCQIAFVWVALFLLVQPAFAAQPWIGVSSAGVVDESAANIYDADTARVTYNASGSVAPIVLRYTLTDTTGTGAPSWSTLELTAYDPAPSSSVRAQILRVLPGATATVANCISGDASVYNTWQCSFSSPIDFNAGNIYAVVVTISRSDATVTPRFGSVRVF